MSCVTFTRALVRPALLVAAASSLAACSAASDPADADPTGSAEESSTGESAEGSSSAEPPTEGTTSASDDPSSRSEDAGVSVPSSWEGTILAEPGTSGTSESEGASYYEAVIDREGRTSLTAEQVAQSEFIAGFDDGDQTYVPDCNSSADTDGAMVLCRLTGEDDSAVVTVQVALAPSAFDKTVVIHHVDGQGPGDFTVPTGTEIVAAASEEDDRASVTEGSAQETVIEAVMLAEHPDGDIPAEVGATCQVLDSGDHLVCDVTGTTDGGGDGTWYGTAQPGDDTEPYYVFGLLPQS